LEVLGYVGVSRTSAFPHILLKDDLKLPSGILRYSADVHDALDPDDQIFPLRKFHCIPHCHVRRKFHLFTFWIFERNFTFENETIIWPFWSFDVSHSCKATFVTR
jgi:hypothetical protein